MEMAVCRFLIPNTIIISNNDSILARYSDMEDLRAMSEKREYKNRKKNTWTAYKEPNVTKCLRLALSG